jgi:hypothetical protein
VSGIVFFDVTCVILASSFSFAFVVGFRAASLEVGPVSFVDFFVLDITGVVLAPSFSFTLGVRLRGGFTGVIFASAFALALVVGVASL